MCIMVVMFLLEDPRKVPGHSGMKRRGRYVKSSGGCLARKGEARMALLVEHLLGDDHMMVSIVMGVPH